MSDRREAVARAIKSVAPLGSYEEWIDEVADAAIAAYEQTEPTADELQRVRALLDVTPELVEIIEAGGELNDYGRGARDMLQRLCARFDEEVAARKARP